MGKLWNWIIYVIQYVQYGGVIQYKSGSQILF